MSAETRAWDVLARAAATRDAAAPARAQRELLVFSLDSAIYALPIERVREIVRPRALTPMPHVPDDVLGVISLRGEIVQVIDARRRLGLAPVAPGRGSRVIVMSGEHGDITGLLVDGVHEVLRVDESELRPPTNTDGGLITALAPRGDRFVSLIAPEFLVTFDAS
ncbi:MAG TPA: chemotaxis protein CheW [Myxococcota bacterium]|jgi:purine-binding chemotaxis protein CheW